MGITVEPIKGDEIKKALAVVDGNPFEYNDVTDSTQRGPAKPKLLTALLGGVDKMMTTTAFVYDEITDTAQLPSGKSYTERGKTIKNDDAKQKIFAIPSFGLRANIRPADYANRRKPGTTEMMDEAYLIAKLTEKLDLGYILQDELGFAKLLTEDKNLVDDGPFTQYNFYTDIVGSSRPSKYVMSLTDTSADHIKLQRDQKKALLEEISKSGETVSAIVEICGDTYFNERLEIERNESLGRPLRSNLDLASMEVNTSDWGSTSFNYDWFKGDQDGIIYINYGAEILTGTKLIADTDAYMIPIGAKNFVGIAYAPAQTQTYVNTEAMKRYSWSNSNEFEGVTLITEENKLFFDKNPRLIRALVDA